MSVELLGLMTDYRIVIGVVLGSLMIQFIMYGLLFHLPKYAGTGHHERKL